MTTDNIWIDLIRLWRAGRVPQAEFMRLTSGGTYEERDAQRQEVRTLLDRHRRVSDLEDLPLF